MSGENLKAKTRAREWFPSTGRLFFYARVAGWTIATPFLLRLLSLPRLMAILTPKPKNPSPSPEPALEKAELADQVVIAILKRNPKYQNRMCLRRSLIMYRYLRLYGAPARFCLGVRKENSRLVGHSWVEINGRHFRDPEENTPYSVTFSFPPDGDRRGRSK